MSAGAEPARGVVFGTAGHVDHGKTTLVKALTGVDTDRWREEKERGLTIDIGFASLDLGEAGEGGLVDVPGHEDFLKNMLAGASGIDALLLAVAADEGPMPQTTEHLAIAALLGVRRGVVAVTKVDRVEPEWREMVEEAAAEEVRRVAGREDWPVVSVSAVTGEGMERLRRRLAEEAARLSGRPGGDLFRMPVDRAFTVHGTGTVVTGTIWSGSVETGDRVRILPGGAEARVRSLQVHGSPRERVAAGRRCAMALVGLDPSEVPRGVTVVADGPWRSSRRIGARLRLLSYVDRPLTHGQRVRVHHGTRETMARVLLPDAGEIPPGGAGPGLLKLERPLVARARDRFVLRFYSPVTTIGGGEVAEPAAAPRWRRRVDAWRAILEGEPAAAVRAVLASRGPRGEPRDQLPLSTGLEMGTIAALGKDPPEGVLVLGGRWFAAEELPAARSFLRDRLSEMHRARRRAVRASLEGLRAAGEARCHGALVARALSELAAAGEIVVEGPGVRLPDHRPALDERERERKGALLRRLAAAGAEPPAVEELAAELGVERDLLNDLLVLLEEEGSVVAVTPEIYLTREAAAELERRARRVLAGGSPASPTEFKRSFGVTRKYLIPLLEYLDRAGVTRRTGEGRELVEAEQAEGEGSDPGRVARSGPRE